MKALLISFSDSSNIGDLLIVESLESNLLVNEDVITYSFNFNKKGDTQSIPSVSRNTIYSLIRKTNLADYFVNKIIKKRTITKFKTSKIKEAIKECDYIVLGGGNTLFDLTKFSDSTFRVKLIFEEAKRQGKKIFVTSIGLGPFNNTKQEENAINTLKDAEYITVRDPKSLHYFEKHNISNAYLSIDPVFINKPKIISNDKEKKSLIGINIMDLSLNKNSNASVNGYEEAMSNLITQLSNEKEHVIHLYCSEPRDQNVVDKIYDSVVKKDNIIKHEILNADELFQLYSELDYIIGTRMHSLIIGLTFKIPVIGISWQQKVSELFKLIRLDEYCIELNDFIDYYQLPSSKLNEIQKNGYKIRPDKILESARKQFDINFKFLNKIKGSILDE